MVKSAAMSKSVLVTGASGFLGSRVVRALVEAGVPVKAMVRASSSLRALSGLSSSQVTVVVGDVRVEHSVYRALAGCDRILHVAAVNRLWSRDPAEILDPAIEGTRAALTAACKRGIRRVVYTSSVATLGTTSAPEPMTEDHPFNLEDPATYIEAKKKAEEVALSFRDKLEVIAALPSVMLGPGDVKPTPAGESLLRFLAWNMPLIDFPVTEGGLNYVDVDDVAQGHLLLLERGIPGERYILGGDNLTYEQLFTMAAELTGVGGPGGAVGKGTAQLAAVLMELRARLGGPEPLLSTKVARDYVGAYAYISSAKAEALGYQHRPARRALARGIQWFLENGYLRDADAKKLRLHLRSPG